MLPARDRRAQIGSEGRGIKRALLEAELAPSTPVAIVESATLPRERQLRTTLGSLAREVTAQEIASPAIIVIGDVVRAREPSANGLAAGHERLESRVPG